MANQVPDLMDAVQISFLLGVSRRHCVERLMKRPDFPRPAINVNRNLKRWRKNDVFKWAGLKG